MEKGQIFYFSDELNDEFSGITRKTKIIDQNYRYIHRNPVWKMGSFFVYRIIMTPVAYLYMKFSYHMKVMNRKILFKHYKDGYFLYGNHTQVPGDGYIPTVLSFPKKDIVVVNADNVSLKGTQTFMEMIGAYPLPNKMDGMIHFMNGLKYYALHKKSIVIYPEAHIWPFYTGIRPYRDASFAYPVLFKKPVYSFTVTYQKRKRTDKPKITTYIDGPFYPDLDISRKAAQKKLRDQVYHAMLERSVYSDYEYVKYIKKDGKEAGEC